MITAALTPAQLYDEAIRLGVAARAFFDGDGLAARRALLPESRLAVATESLRLTARLMEIMAALLVLQTGGTMADRPRDRTPVPERLGGRARELATCVRDLYLRLFGDA